MEKLKAEIELLRDAEKQETLKTAETQAENIIKEAKEKAEEIRRRKIKQLEESLNEQMESKLQAAKLIANRMVLKARSELFDKAIELSKQQLQNLSEEPRYKEALKELIIEASSKLKGKELEILVNSKDANYLMSNVKILEAKASEVKKSPVRLSLSQDSISCLGGAIVKTKDGKQIYNNTLDARLSRVKKEKALEITNLLFEGTEP
jgi:vacuolar-type H+-ATPase subunit E/Vma4